MGRGNAATSHRRPAGLVRHRLFRARHGGVLDQPFTASDRSALAARRQMPIRPVNTLSTVDQRPRSMASAAGLSSARHEIPSSGQEASSPTSASIGPSIRAQRPLARDKRMSASGAERTSEKCWSSTVHCCDLCDAPQRVVEHCSAFFPAAEAAQKVAPCRRTA